MAERTLNVTLKRSSGQCVWPGEWETPCSCVGDLRCFPSRPHRDKLGVHFLSYDPDEDIWRTLKVRKRTQQALRRASWRGNEEIKKPGAHEPSVLETDSESDNDDSKHDDYSHEAGDEPASAVPLLSRRRFHDAESVLRSMRNNPKQRYTQIFVRYPPVPRDLFPEANGVASPLSTVGIPDAPPTTHKTKQLKDMLKEGRVGRITILKPTHFDQPLKGRPHQTLRTPLADYLVQKAEGQRIV